MVYVYLPNLVTSCHIDIQRWRSSTEAEITSSLLIHSVADVLDSGQYNWDAPKKVMGSGFALS